jgi:hypothetical protein
VFVAACSRLYVDGRVCSRQGRHSPPYVPGKYELMNSQAGTRPEHEFRMYIQCR